jgi:hypothetical protein
MLQENFRDALHDSAEYWRTRAEELLDASDKANEEARKWDSKALDMRGDVSSVRYAQRCAWWHRSIGYTYLMQSGRFLQEAVRAEALGRY